MQPKLEVINNQIHLNSKVVFLEKGGRYSEIEYYFEDMLRGQNRDYDQESDQIYEQFEQEIERCREESDQVEETLEVFPLEFSSLTAKELLTELSAIPDNLLQQAKLTYEENPDDDGFRRSYWILANDIQKYPYFSALSLYVRLQEESYRNSYKIRQIESALNATKASLEKAKKAYRDLMVSLADCKDVEYVNNKLKEASIDDYAKDVELKEKELNELKLNTRDCLLPLKGLNNVFDAMIEKLLAYKPI